MQRLARTLRRVGVGALFLVALELALRGLGAFDPTELADPYLGFPGTAPLYRLEKDASGELVHRTSPNKRNAYQDLAFPRAKAPREFRAFTVGGSSIQAAFYREPPSSMSDFLQLYLRAGLPDRAPRVINCGGGATGSVQNLEVVREVLDLEPDLIVVYPEGGEKNAIVPAPGGVLAVRDAASPARVAARRLLAPLRVYVAGRELLQALVPGSRAARRLSAFSAIVAHAYSRPFGPDSFGRLFELKHDKRPVLMEHVIPAAEMQRGRERFRRDLAAMAELAAERGVPLCFVHPQRNLESSFYLRFHVAPAEIRPGEIAAWTQAYDRALEAKRAGRFAEALRSFEAVRATYVADRDEILAFFMAECLTALGRDEEALREYAHPLERHPLRAILSEVAAEKGVPLIDPFPALVEAAGGKAPGYALFVDSYHPLPHGQQVLARAIFAQLVEQRVVDGLLPWHEIRIDAADAACNEIVRESNQRNVGASNFLAQAVRTGDFERAVDIGRRQGEEWLLRTPVTLIEYGWALTSTGRIDEARALFERSRAVLFPEGAASPDLSSSAAMIEHAFAGDVFAYF
jgi:tetratricopeptide (TPR) repeat protein